MYSEEIRTAALKLHNQGNSYSEIGLIMQLTKSTVRNLLKYHKSSHKMKRGPKFTLTKRKSTILKRFIQKENESGKKVNAAEIIRSNELTCSRRTVCRWLKKHDYKYRKEAQKIVLSQKHKSERILKISLWVSKNIQWENTAFVDEKRFSLDGPDNW